MLQCYYLSMYHTTNATNDTDSANAPLNLNEILYFTTNVLLKYHDITFLCVKNVQKMSMDFSNCVYENAGKEPEAEDFFPTLQ